MLGEGNKKWISRQEAAPSSTRGTRGRGANGFEGLKHLLTGSLDVVSATAFPLAAGMSGVVSFDNPTEALPQAEMSAVGSSGMSWSPIDPLPQVESEGQAGICLRPLGSRWQFAPQRQGCHQPIVGAVCIQTRAHTPHPIQRDVDPRRAGVDLTLTLTFSIA